MADTTPKTIAVVILNWNGKALLEQFLPSVVAHSEKAHIYLADNASTDDSVAFVQANYPQITVIQNQGNYGFAKGYNEALQQVSEPIYALVNSGIEVTAGWLDPFLDHFATHPNTAIAQPKLMDFKNKSYFEYAGAAGGFIDQYGFPYCRGRVFDTLEEDHGQYNTPAKIFWATGACFFIRKEVYWELGGLDGDFFAHQEEIDLCWRNFNAGYDCYYLPEATVYHVGGATLKTGTPRKTFLNFRNSLLMLLKNLPQGKRFSIIFIRLCLDGIAGVQFLFKGNLRHTLAILKAHFSFYGQIAPTMSKRSTSQRKDYFTVKSIVWNYFVRKQKHFER